MNKEVSRLKNRLKKCVRLANQFIFKKLNNQGSTLLTVIICIAFISILGSMMLSVTMTNLQMKIVESKSKKNFYSCEEVMEKIRVAVQEKASESVKYVYENEVLAKYATYLALPEIDINPTIKRNVAAKMLRTIGGFTETTTDDQILAQASSTGIPIITNYFLGEGYLTPEDNGMVTWPVLMYNATATTSTIRMNQITIQYENGDYRTAIASDIVVTIPDFSFTNTIGTEVVNYLLAQPFPNYIMLADKSITSNNSSGVNNISGNIYAGLSGININGQNVPTHTVNLNDGTIVTRGDITVSNTAKLNIGTSSTITPLIWAKNLITNTTFNNPSGTTDLNINAISVIKDDLVLDGLKSNVNFLGGAYIGYTGTHDAEGSAMIINGAGSSLNLLLLNDLVLAGRAHVSVADSGLDKKSDILTGESIAFKSNQRAYLLPGKFIKDIKHNPITLEDYTTSGLPVIEITNDTETTGIKYTEYVDVTSLTTDTYKIAAKKTGSTVLRYYYFNFTSGKLADAFLKRYTNSAYYSTLNMMKPFSIGNVTLPIGGTASVVGNSMSYNSTDGVKLTDGLSLAYTDDATLDTAIANTILSAAVYNSTALKDKKVGMLSNAYSQLTHLLTIDNAEVYLEGENVVESAIVPGGVGTIILRNSPLATTTYTDFKKNNGNITCNNTTNSTLKSFWVVNGNVTINANAFYNGFLIATGDITIGDGAKINGLIISTGENGTSKITVGNGANVIGQIATVGEIMLGQGCNLSTYASPETDEIAALFAAEGTILKELFNDSEMTVNIEISNPAPSLVDLSQIMSYENWKKIE